MARILCRVDETHTCTLMRFSQYCVEMDVTIRRAEESDLDWLLVQLRAFDDFHGSKHKLFSEPEFVSNVMRTLMADHLMLVAVNESGEQMGFISGMVTGHFLNPKIKTLTEVFWWVDQKHRFSRAGVMLLNAYTEWGKANADWVVFSLEHHSPVADRSMIKRGYALKERGFLMEVC